jgi:NAD(P)-dependent dehydrogenase (short-subunit alcohol dehydrogenase family)
VVNGAERGVALITGAARRLGRVLALAAAEAGYDVAVHHRGDPEAQVTCDLVRARGRRCETVAAELTDPAALADLAADAEAALGPVTLLVNNASLFQPDGLAELTPASLAAHLDANLRAPILLAQAVSARLPTGREGLIVNLLDQRVWRPTPEFFSYGVSRGALWTATRMMAQALAPRWRVNAIGPGPTLASIHQASGEFAAEAEGTLLGRPVAPEEIGKALSYLIDARAVTGQMIAVDSGQHLA